jgi:hypothetical protein
MFFQRMFPCSWHGNVFHPKMHWSPTFNSAMINIHNSYGNEFLSSTELWSTYTNRTTMNSYLQLSRDQHMQLVLHWSHNFNWAVIIIHRLYWRPTFNPCSSNTSAVVGELQGLWGSPRSSSSSLVQSPRPLRRLNASSSSAWNRHHNPRWSTVVIHTVEIAHRSHTFCILLSTLHNDKLQNLSSLPNITERWDSLVGIVTKLQIADRGKH